ncbi:Helix-loop-helix DNA-binding domain containing protein [Hordeum vulgare]|nr:Helix-loop-helix DNA-binding domain containing protein [Hordeum vulgare]
MDVSSNTTTTTSGGGGGGKDRDKGKGASVSFTEGEKVLAYHGPLLYEAKRRKEKINDKLQVLQKLVPNGTKVDLSNMLEEAVLYVKFLQLRIKFAAAIPSFL